MPLPTLDLATLANVQPQPKAFAVERLAPLAEVTLFTGPGSAGKSLFGQQLATCAAAGMPCLGLEVRPGAALYLTCEDDAEQLHWRQASICKALRVGMASLAGKLHLASLRGALDNELGTIDHDGTLKPAAAFQRLVQMLQVTGAQLAILDNVAHLFTGNENDRGEVTRFVNLLNRLAGETGAAILLLGHPNKSGDDYSGSTAWLNAVRSQATLAHDLETDVRTITVGKANYARKGEAIRFIWFEGAFVREEDLPDDDARYLRETVQASSDNLLFLSCLQERTRQRRAVSDKLSATYAPKVFAGMPESKGVGKDRMEKAMDRLFRTGAIERAEVWKGDDRKPVFGLRETAKAGAADRFPQTSEGR
nr:AAA family ATPase [Novosphingobium olei]